MLRACGSPDRCVRSSSAMGGRGGQARARSMPAAARAAVARRAALRRWIRVRFGDRELRDPGASGGALIDQGLDDLAGGRATPESLLVSLAAPRLRREAIPLPTHACKTPTGASYPAVGSIPWGSRARTLPRPAAPGRLLRGRLPVRVASSRSPCAMSSRGTACAPSWRRSPGPPRSGAPSASSSWRWYRRVRGLARLVHRRRPLRGGGRGLPRHPGHQGAAQRQRRVRQARAVRPAAARQRAPARVRWRP